MARKHFNEYLAKIKAQYQEMIEITKALVKELEEGNVSEERVEAYKKRTEVIARNYFAYQHVNRLLNRRKNYEEEMEFRALKGEIGKNDPDSLLEEGGQALEDLRQISDKQIVREKFIVETEE